MKNQFRLEINELCSKNFTDFTPTKAGGFCHSCTKEVIDFTEMSSQEIINYFKENTDKNTCGRFADYQLGNYVETKHKSKSYSFWKGVGLACLSLFTFNTIQAQEVKPKIEVASNVKQSQKINQEKRNITIKGTVVDESGPLPSANVLLQGTTIGVETDFNGNFEFPKKLKEGDVLLFSFVGMETQKVVITNKHTTSKINQLHITMKSDSCMLLGKVAVKKVYKSNKKF